MITKNPHRQIVVFIGPPGSGKGTQAEYLVDEFGFFHIETSRIIQEAFSSHDDRETIVVDGIAYSYGEERRKFFAGELNTTEVVTHWIKEATAVVHGQGKDIVFCGSPRTALEAENLFPLFHKLVGPQQCFVFHLDVPYEVSLERNLNRLLCIGCRLPHREGTAEACRRCGGLLKRREGLDTEEVMRTRWQEFQARTLPILGIARGHGLSVVHIDATLPEDEVWARARANIVEPSAPPLPL